MKTWRRWAAWAVVLGVPACGAAEDPAAGKASGKVSHAVSLPAPAVLAPSCGDHEDDHDDESTRALAANRVVWQRKKPGRPKTAAAKILGFNDFHGQLSEGRLVAGRPVGGAAVLASYLKTASHDFPGRHLIIHAGDFVGASPPDSALLQDEPSIQFLNTLANDECDGAARADRECNIVGTPGNHEFDEGKGELLRLVYGGNHPDGPFLENPYRGARFPYVSANVVSDDRKQRPLLPPYVIRKLDRAKVGVIGAVLKETPTIVTPAGVAGLKFLDEATAINARVAELKRRGVHTIVVTIHQGAFQQSYTGPTNPAAALGSPIRDIVSALDDEVDVVISGHSHTFSNALVATPSGHQILVTQAFAASTAYADIDLTIDLEDGDVLTKSASIVTTFSDVAPGNVRDAAVQSIVTEAKALTDPLVNRPIAIFTADITRAQTTAGESALGNLIADAQRAATGTDFAFMNPGGIRQELFFAKSPTNPADADGTALWGELFTIQPFGNSLVTMNLTGQQIYDLLNQQFAVNRFLQISGLDYTWDASLPAASRVVEIRKDGLPIDVTATYTVTANNFIATGGDGFTVFTQGTNQVGGDIDLDALIAYVTSLPQPFSAPALGRITRLN